MNEFQKRIQAEIDRGSHRPLGIPQGIHTIGEFIDAVLQIDNEKDARAFYEGLLEYINERPSEWKDSATFKRDGAEGVARSDIGWCFGEGMSPKRIAMWRRVCQASHPVFGDTVPDSSEALKKGIEMGKEVVRDAN